MANINDAINTLSPEELDLLNSDPQMLAQFKAKYGGGEAVQTPWSSVPANFMKDVRTLGNGMVMIGEKVINLPKDTYDSLVGILHGQNPRDTPIVQNDKMVYDLLKGALPSLGKDAQGATTFEPGGILSRAKEIATSPVESFKEHPLNTALDVLSVADPALRAVTGTEAGATVAEAAGKAGTAVSDAAGSVAKKAMSAVLGPPEDAIAARLANPEAIKNAQTFEELSKEVPKALTTLNKQVEAGSKAAWDTLRTSSDPNEGAFSKAEIVQAIKTAKRDLIVPGGGIVGPADKNAARLLDGIIQDIKKLGGNKSGTLESISGVKSAVRKSEFVSEAAAGNIIRALDGNINWDAQGAESANTVLEKARTSIDGILKTQNPDYAAAMEPVAQKVKLLQDIKRNFNIKSAPGEGLVPSNATEGNLRNVLGKNKAVSRKNLADLKSATGQDILKSAENSASAEAFNGPYVNGSRRVNLMATMGGGVGTAAGGVLGGFPGAGAGGVSGTMAGALLGAYLDKEGANIAGRLLDWYSKPSMVPQLAQKAGTPLVDLLRTLARRSPTGSILNDIFLRQPATSQLASADNARR